MPERDPLAAQLEQFHAPASHDLTTDQVAEALEQRRSLRLFGSGAFFRLWVAQVVSSLGDWVGLFAILALAARIGGGPGSVGLVMSARMIPGFFLASVGGVLVDRWDRKRVMVACDIGRGLVLATLPFIHTVWGLFLASLAMEVLSLLWSPAKDASVPNLVEADQLTTVNSLSLVAAYGTFVPGSLIFAFLATVADWLGHYHALHVLRVNHESIAIYADVLTFFTSAALISTLTLAKRHGHDKGRIDLTATISEVKEGWQFIRTNRVVRAVMIGIGTGLMGGGMVIPLGPTFSKKVLHGGPAGFGLLLTALGTGMAVGVVSLSAIQKRLPRERIFTISVLVGGVLLFLGASMSSLPAAMAFVVFLGAAGGSVYVIGFTILQENVEDELRGRIFAALYTLIRFCLLFALTVTPLLVSPLDDASKSLVHRRVHLGSLGIALPGERLALWLGALIILAAGLLAARALRGRQALTT